MVRRCDDIAGDVCLGVAPTGHPALKGAVYLPMLGIHSALCVLYSVHVSPQPVRWLGARPRHGGASAVSRAHHAVGFRIVPC